MLYARAQGQEIKPFIISHLFAGPIVLFAICLFLIFIDDPKTIDTSIILKTDIYWTRSLSKKRQFVFAFALQPVSDVID